MTQTHIIESKKSGINIPALIKSTRGMTHGAVKANGELEHKVKRTYIQVKGPGYYTVVHNMNRIDYGVSVASEGASIETSNLTDISFDVHIRKDGELVAAPFVFAINIVQKADG